MFYEMDPFYRIEEDSYYNKWYIRKYTVRLKRAITDPVTELRCIIQDLSLNFNYHNEAAVSFGGEDSNGS